MKLGKSINFLQAGGPMPAEGGAPAPQGGQDPAAMLLQAAQQAVQSQDCQIAMQLAQMVIEMLGGAMAQGGAPAEEAPAPEEGQPVYRMGGRLLRRIKD